MKHAVLVAVLLALGCGSSTTPAESGESTAAQGGEAEAVAHTPVTVPDVAGLSPEEALAAVVGGSHRDPAKVARDRYRHPAETLAFFGARPGLDVLEMWPGGGWYTEILAPLVGAEGSLTCAITSPEADGYRGTMARDFLAWQEREPNLLGHVRTVVFNPPDAMSLGEPESYDLVVTFRNTHNWVQDGVAEQAFAEVFRVLRPGGVLGLVQHRDAEGAEVVAGQRRGWLPQAYVVGLAEAAGFRLEETSEVNANPSDTRDYPEQVWSLPPSFREGDANRARYEAIGESDRMTLRFVKPAE